MTAPDKIWAFEDGEGGIPRAGYWFDEQSEAPEGSLQYTRTGLIQPAAENATLRAEADRSHAQAERAALLLTDAVNQLATLRASEAAAWARVKALDALASVLVQFVEALAEECDADLDDVVLSVRIMPEGREVAEVSATDIISKVAAITTDKEPTT